MVRAVCGGFNAHLFPKSPVTSLSGFPGFKPEAIVGALSGLQQSENVLHDAAVFGEIGMPEQSARCVAGIDGFHAFHDN